MVSTPDEAGGLPNAASPDRTRQVVSVSLGNVDFEQLQAQRRMVGTIADGYLHALDKNEAEELAEGLWEFLSNVMDQCARILGDSVVYGDEG